LASAGFQNLSQGTQDVVALETFANDALTHNLRQKDTMICILEKISEQTCSLLNEGHLQTELQTETEQHTAKIGQLLSFVHADAALEWERNEQLRRQIRECCPPGAVGPFCEYERCPAPEPFKETPPRPKSNPFEPTAPE
jgi:hypothetical protein